MPDTFHVIGDSGPYHRDRGCPALDTARLHSTTGRVHTIPTDHAAGRRPCIVCTDTNPTEWTVTTDNIRELWELIGPSKYYKTIDGTTNRVVIDGLTILEHGNAPRALARFGDTIRFDRNGHYTVHPAAEVTR